MCQRRHLQTYKSELKGILLTDLPEKIENKINLPVQNIITTGISWVDGGTIFKPDTKWSQAWFGICHYSMLVFSVWPLDRFSCTQLKSIDISLAEDFCSKAHLCLNFDCTSSITKHRMNKFNKFLFANEFKDLGPYSLGLPQNIGTETLWFNKATESKDWPRFWKRLITPYVPDGVVLMKRKDEPLVKV